VKQPDSVCVILRWRFANIKTRQQQQQQQQHPFNGPSPGTTRVSWYQKGKTNLDFTEARDSEWQWHQLGHMQVCTSLQHPTTQFFTGRMLFLPPNQQRQKPKAVIKTRQEKSKLTTL